jgi:arsenate reductase
LADVPEVLYVCVHNAGRSQMAAVLTQRLGGDRVRVRSAGSAPGEHVHPVVVEAMREIGIDLGAEFPKLLTPDAVRAAGVVVTMGCGDACPVFPGKSYRDWKVDDPKGRSIEDVRRIRDEIRRRVESLLDELGVRRRG